MLSRPIRRGSEVPVTRSHPFDAPLWVERRGWISFEGVAQNGARRELVSVVFGGARRALCAHSVTYACICVIGSFRGLYSR